MYFTPFVKKTEGILHRHDTDELNSVPTSARDILQLSTFAKSYRDSK